MLAEPSPVDHVIESDVDRRRRHSPCEIISLAGHSPNQVGFLVDGVFFCADIVLPEAVLDKYKIPYLFSAGDHLASLESCTDVACEAIVPGHGALLDTLAPLRDLNRSLVLDVVERIVEACARPVGAETDSHPAATALRGAVSDAPGYYLLHPTVFAFLAYLARARAVAK